MAQLEREANAWNLTGHNVYAVTFLCATSVGLKLFPESPKKAFACGFAAAIASRAVTRTINNRLYVKPAADSVRDCFGLNDKKEVVNPQQAKDAYNTLKGVVGVNNSLSEYITSLKAGKTMQSFNQKEGLSSTPKHRHMVFQGAPGTGKTEAAKLMATLLLDAGVIRKNKITMADRSTLIGEHVGKTV